MIYSSLALALLCLSSCNTIPAYADVLPPGQEPGHVIFPDPVPPTPKQLQISPKLEVRGLPPIDSPALRGGPAPGLVYDSPTSGRGAITRPLLIASWRGAPENWNPPGLDGPGLGSGRNGNNNGNNQQNGGNGNGNNGCGNGNGGPNGGKDCGGGKPPQPPIPQPGVPGPLPVLGAGVAFGWARRMRRRVGK